MGMERFSDLDGVVSGLRSGAFLDSVDGDVLRRYWGYSPWGEGFQIGFHRSTARVRAVIAGNRCGKSLSAIMETFIIATGNIPDSMKGWYPREKLAPANSLLFFGTIKEDMHEEIAIPLVEKFVPLRAFGIRYAKSEGCYYCPRGVKIFLKSYEAGWETFQGSGVWYVNLDEEPSDKKIYTECLTRILSTNGYISLTFTPLSGYTWSYFDLFQGAEKDAGIKIFRANMRESPYLRREDVDDILKKYPAHERRSRECGDYTVAIEKHVYDSGVVNGWINSHIPPSGYLRFSLAGAETGRVSDYRLGVVKEDCFDEYVPFSEGCDQYNPTGIWQIWEEPRPGRGYIMGVDVASGHGKFTNDHSVAHIKSLSSGGGVMHVATLRSNCIKPYEFGKLCLYAAKYYNNAMIVCENEGYGDSCLSAFEWYPHQWYSNVYDQQTRRATARKAGFTMKESTRKNTLEVERELISRSSSAIVNEIETLREMMNFTFGANGRYDHPKGGRSDGIIASAMADAVLMRYPYLVKDCSRRTETKSVSGAGYRYPEDNPKHVFKARRKAIGMSNAKYVGGF